jgi:hypothetical protein
MPSMPGTKLPYVRDLYAAIGSVTGKKSIAKAAGRFAGATDAYSHIGKSMAIRAAKEHSGRKALGIGIGAAGVVRAMSKHNSRPIDSYRPQRPMPTAQGSGRYA